ncbi:CehA/McbA family metallohydrolase [Frankia sp. CcWB2]
MLAAGHSTVQSSRDVDTALRAWTQPGQLYRGQLHCHSTDSDGLLSVEEVIATYQAAGHNWIVLSDHYEATYDWRLADTTAFSSEEFTAIVGAELSSAAWTDRHCYWVTAAGLPLDFAPPPDDSPAAHVDAIMRAKDAGAFLVLLHPGLNNLPLGAADTISGLHAVDAVEIYNHSMATMLPHGADGSYFYDGLLEAGHRLFVDASDDAHFEHPDSHGGGWLQVRAERNSPDAILQSLKAGAYYATQGPEITAMSVRGNQLDVHTSPARAIVLAGGGDQWLNMQQQLPTPHEQITSATFDLSSFSGKYCRVTVVAPDGRCAWSNPLWP